MNESPKFSHKVDHPRRRLTTTTVGQFTAQDVREHMKAREEEGSVEYDHLVDMTDGQIALDTAEIGEIAKHFNKTAVELKRGRTAFLVKDKLSFGMLRMFAMLAEPEFSASVFESRAEALRWLGWRDEHQATKDSDRVS